MKEWRIVEEATNYEVSNYGEVRNKKTSHILVGSKDKDGYERVLIRNNNGKLITRFKHRLAAIAFLPNPNSYPVINHKDEVKNHNYIGCKEKNYEDGNLEWCSQKYNVRYNNGVQRRAAKREETYKRKNGKKIIYAYDYITHEKIGAFSTIKEAAAAFKCDYSEVWRVLHKQRRYSHNIYFEFQTEELDNSRNI